MRGLGAALACALVTLVSGHAGTARGAALAVPSDLRLIADADDDDADGTRDGLQSRVTGLARRDLGPLAFAYGKRVALSGAHARVLLRGQPLALPAFLPAGAELQGVRPGVDQLLVGEGSSSQAVAVQVVGHAFEDVAAAELDPSRERLTFSRAAPEASPSEDPDGFRVTRRGDGGDGSAGAPAHGAVDVLSLSARGVLLDAIRGVPIDSPCASPKGVPAPSDCARSRPLRLVIDSVDRQHPRSLGRSLLGEVGGLVVVTAEGRKRTSIHVGGPRATGVSGRYRVRIRATLFRTDKSGKPGIFSNEAEALAEVRADLEDAALLWAQCGLSFRGEGDMDLRIASPPPPHLVSFGTDLGLPSAGGVLRVKVEGKRVVLTIPPGRPPVEVARLFAVEVEKAGFRAQVSRNARITPGASGSADVTVAKLEGRLGHGTLARVEADGVLSTDPVLAVAIGAVDLSDGLTHFGDMDSPSGSLEERALVKSLEDTDPRVVQLLYVPYFFGGGRVGESFIYGDGSSLKNVIIVDRSGVRSRRSSHAVAHELGHVLLDVPGHPDDFGRDTPSLLMDSDASDASVYGPRRLTDDECARVRAESGPRAKVPILEPWPFAPVPFPPLGP